MGRFVCQCCGYLTLPRQGPGTNEVCEVCGWKDDLEQFQNSTRPDGANPVSLKQAQEYFEDFGVSDPRLRFEGKKPPQLTVGPAGTWAIISGICLFVVLAMMPIGSSVFLPYRVIGEGLFLGFAISGAVFFAVWADSQRRGPRKGIGCCRQCGYRLQGIEQRRCPECGTAF